MDLKKPAADRLVSRAELAELAGVRRPTVTTWAKRHADFPQPVRLGDGQFFPVSGILPWLDRRPIPDSSRWPGEVAGVTYGDRVRHKLEIAYRGRPDDAPDLAGAGPASDPESRVDPDNRPAQSILEFLRGRYRDGTSGESDLLYLVMILNYLRTCVPDVWPEIRAISQQPTQNLRPTMVIRRIGELADRALRRQGVPSDVRSRLELLAPPPSADLAELIGVCDRPDVSAFEALRERYAAAMNFDSGAFFTPRAVTSLLVRIAAGEGEQDLPVYDPWVRGGEMLREVGNLLGPESPVRGTSPSSEALQLAAMNLALHGQHADLRLSSARPWMEPPPEFRAGAVVMNPPFNRRAARPDTGPDRDWLFGPPPVHNDNYAWLQYAVTCLSPEGRAAVLMPHQASSSSDEREHAIRREMVEQGAVEAIVALPARLFPGTDTTVIAWFLSRPTETPKQVLLVDASTMVATQEGTVILSPDADTEIAQLFRARQDLSEGEVRRLPGGALAISVGVQRLRWNDYSLDPADYVDHVEPDDDSEPVSAISAFARLEQLHGEILQEGVYARPVRPQPAGRSLGALPDGWLRVPLGEVCEIQAGPAVSRLGPDERTPDGSVPIVMPRHLRQGEIVANDIDKATHQTAERLARFQLLPGDILCIRAGAMSQPTLVNQEHEGWLFGANLHRLRIRAPERVDARYLKRFLNLPSTLEWLHRRSRATVIPTINSRDLSHLIVTVPPLTEQQEIESALTLLDRQIAVHEEYVRAAHEARSLLTDELIKGSVIV
ncbi:hypothetical protein GCM10010404_18080 [Nonomuraea africana]|uniref:N-6 DNA methylase n=1 Tax=Nonomuraea africana TaxID=46171 RepID=UPI00298EDC5E|nr:N-6 DNA methylase [Nonomuraea africana]